MTIYRSAPGDYGHEESESACIELNDNDVAGFIDINEYTYAEEIGRASCRERV